MFGKHGFGVRSPTQPSGKGKLTSVHSQWRGSLLPSRIEDLHLDAANLPTFNEALKTGVDPIIASPAYVAAAGSGTRDTQSLHRIDPEVIKVEVTAAGFMLEAESNALMNPSDDLAVRSRQGASQVMLRFRKPR